MTTKYDLKCRAYHKDTYYEKVLIQHPFVTVHHDTSGGGGEQWYATHPNLGCGKNYFTSTGAIDGLLGDNGYFDIDVLEQPPEDGRGSGFGPVEVVVISVEGDRIETHSTVRTFARYDDARAYCREECKWESTVECLIPRTLDKFEGEHNQTRLEAIRRREITPVGGVQ